MIKITGWTTKFSQGRRNSPQLVKIAGCHLVVRKVVIAVLKYTYIHDDDSCWGGKGESKRSSAFRRETKHLEGE